VAGNRPPATSKAFSVLVPPLAFKLFMAVVTVVSEVVKPVLVVTSDAKETTPILFPGLPGARIRLAKFMAAVFAEDNRLGEPKLMLPDLSITRSTSTGLVTGSTPAAVTVTSHLLHSAGVTGATVLVKETCGSAAQRAFWAATAISRTITIDPNTSI